jgi:hypothetical protein
VQQGKLCHRVMSDGIYRLIKEKQALPTKKLEKKNERN